MTSPQHFVLNFAKWRYLAFGVEADVVKGSDVTLKLCTWIDPDSDGASRVEIRKVKLTRDRRQWDLGNEDNTAKEILEGLGRSHKAYIAHYGRKRRSGTREARAVPFFRGISFGW